MMAALPAAAQNRHARKTRNPTPSHRAMGTSARSRSTIRCRRTTGAAVSAALPRAAIELGPGEHRRQVLSADHGHVPHDPPPVREPVTITMRA